MGSDIIDKLDNAMEGEQILLDKTDDDLNVVLKDKLYKRYIKKWNTEYANETGWFSSN